MSCLLHKLEFNPLRAELNPICHLLELLGAHPILHVSRIRVNYTFHWSQPFDHFTYRHSFYDPLAEHPLLRIQCGAYEGVSRNSRTEEIAKYTTPNKRVWNLPTSTQLRANWHTDSLDVVVPPSTGASGYHNCCIDGDISPEYFGYNLVYRDARSTKHKT
jgi:hypothetical protein